MGEMGAGINVSGLSYHATLPPLFFYEIVTSVLTTFCFFHCSYSSDARKSSNRLILSSKVVIERLSEKWGGDFGEGRASDNLGHDFEFWGEISPRRYLGD